MKEFDFLKSVKERIYHDLCWKLVQQDRIMRIKLSSISGRVDFEPFFESKFLEKAELTDQNFSKSHGFVNYEASKEFIQQNYKINFYNTSYIVSNDKDHIKEFLDEIGVSSEYSIQDLLDDLNFKILYEKKTYKGYNLYKIVLAFDSVFDTINLCKLFTSKQLKEQLGYEIEIDGNYWMKIDKELELEDFDTKYNVRNFDQMFKDISSVIDKSKNVVIPNFDTNHPAVIRFKETFNKNPGSVQIYDKYMKFNLLIKEYRYFKMIFWFYQNKITYTKNNIWGTITTNGKITFDSLDDLLDQIEQCYNGKTDLCQNASTYVANQYYYDSSVDIDEFKEYFTKYLRMIFHGESSAESITFTSKYQDFEYLPMPKKIEETTKEFKDFGFF